MREARRRGGAERVALVDFECEKVRRLASPSCFRDEADAFCPRVERHAYETLEVVVAVDDRLPLSVCTKRLQPEVSDEGGRWRERKIVKPPIVAQIEKSALTLIAGWVRAVEVAVEDEARFGEFGLEVAGQLLKPDRESARVGCGV